MRALVVSALLIVCAAAFAQTSAAPPADTVELKAHTPVIVLLQQDISTKTLKLGDTIPFTVGHELRAHNLIVIPNGMPLTATVTKLEPPHRRSRGAKLELTFNSVTALDGTPLTLTFDSQGDFGSGAAAAGGIIYLTRGLGTPIAVALYLGSKGDDIEIPQHTALLATASHVTLDGDKLRAAQPPHPTAGNALVIAYRADNLQRARGVWCGRVKIRDLWPGQLTRVALPPGRYAFYTDYGQPLVYDLAPGDELYLRMQTRNFWDPYREHSYLLDSSFEQFLGPTRKRVGNFGPTNEVRAGIRNETEDTKAQRRLDSASPEDLHFIPEKWKKP